MHGHRKHSTNYESHVVVVLLKFSQHCGDRTSHHDSMQQETVMIKRITSHFGRLVAATSKKMHHVWQSRTFKCDDVSARLDRVL